MKLIIKLIGDTTMKNLIDKAAITANTTEEIYKQVINELESRGYYIADNESDVFNFFADVYPKKNINDDILVREVQRIELDGIPQKYSNYTYIPTITVRIYENYVDSGSFDYGYTVSVKEE